jgi:hypothetical protein
LYFICSYAFFAAVRVAGFPQGSDALVYHIPLAVRWLQDGSLRIPDSKAWQLSLPGNGEIIMMLALATGKQSLVALGNWISIPILMISASFLGLSFCSNKKAALDAVLIVLSIPMIEFKAFSGYIDLFGMALLLAAFALFVRRYRLTGTGEPAKPMRILCVVTIFVSALACGVSLGTKLTFLPYCAFYFLIVASTLWTERAIHNRPIGRLLIWVVIGMLLPSAFWFGRELRATGNPFYPLKVSIGHHLVFPGNDTLELPPQKHLLYNPPAGAQNHGDRRFVRRASEWWIYPWTEWLSDPGSFPIVYGEGSGLGGAFAAFVTVGILFTFYLSFSGEHYNGVERVRRYMVLSWLMLLLLWTFSLHRILRFGLPLWVFAALLAVPAIELMMTAAPRLVGTLLVSSILTTCFVTSLVPLHEIVSHVRSKAWSRSAIYDYPTIIDNLPSGTTVLNDSRFPENDFALAGKRLTNRVINAFEAPRELTPEFIRTSKVNYIVNITSATQGSSASSAENPGALGYAEVFHAYRGSKLWSIWQVSTCRSGSTGSDSSRDVETH